MMTLTYLGMLLVSSMGVGRLTAYIDSFSRWHHSNMPGHRFPLSIIYGRRCRGCRTQLPPASLV